jgi:exopolysaccharide biosynthesis polyprenyl glycosylphosphotransferase
MPPAGDGATVGAGRARRSDAPLEFDAAVLPRPVRVRPWDRVGASRWAQPALDFLALATAFAVASALTPGNNGIFPIAAFPFLAALVLYLRGAYRPRLRPILLDTFGLAAGSVSVAAMCTLAVELALNDGAPGAGLLFRAWFIGVVFLAVDRALYTLEQQHLRSKGVTAKRTLIVGAGAVGARVGRRLNEAPAYGLHPIGFLDADPPPAAAVGGRTVPVLGPPSVLPDLVERLHVQHLILAFSGAADRSLLPLVRRCLALGIGVSLVPRLFDSINDRVAYDPVGGLPVLTLRSTDPNGKSFAIKHAIDRVGAAVLVVVLAPLLLLIALAVRLTSRGPVLFRQRRVGRDGQAFDILKFRTMVGGEARDAAPTFVLPPPGVAPGGVEGHDRRTRVGRLLRRVSLDELPQLINVLRGEMSLVGPRPERPEFVEGFTADMERYSERHRVRSGITGLSQIHGLRGPGPIADRVELDNYYIEHWSLALDFKILLLTPLVVFRAAG